MHEEIQKAIMFNEIIELIYVASNGAITKRQVKPYKMEQHYFKAYCFLRRSRRTFAIDQVLACAPVIRQKRAVI